MCHAEIAALATGASVGVPNWMFTTYRETTKES
jgi:hypothetical protein